MIQKIRSSKTTKIISLFLLINFLIEIFQPLELFALTGGPSQPEMAGFTPANTDNMVDLFSGDFHYTIPIMTVPGPNGGYPINLNYNSGIGMEYEASWVGLGWNLNPGAINRQVRGIPDDFNGDTISKTYKRRDNNTIVYTPGDGGEFFGANFGVGASLSQSIIYNTFHGLTMSQRFGVSASYIRQNNTVGNSHFSVGSAVNLDSDDGVTPSFSINGGTKNMTLGANFGYNCKSGTYTYSNQISLNFVSEKNDSQGHTYTRGGGISMGNSFSTASVLPPIYIQLTNTTYSNSFIYGGSGEFLEGHHSIGASFCNQKTPSGETVNKAYGLCYAQNANDLSLKDFNREKELCVDQNSLNLPLPIMTYDIYSINGETMGGCFRQGKIIKMWFSLIM